tara:strand:- start:473 stop:721 length:249 start_codon:yes stop_codon:yes gene_type:complete
MSYMEDKEWDLLDKRLNGKEKDIITINKRITIKLDEDQQDTLASLLMGKRDTLTIGCQVIDGILKTNEVIDVTLMLTDGDES